MSRHVDTVDNRVKQIVVWLTDDLGLSVDTLEPASADASFRRYFRVKTGDATRIVMDAPPEKEDIKPFIIAAEALTRQGVHAPAVLSSNLDAGFLLLEDLGDQTYLQHLPSHSDRLYGNAINSLIKLQKGGLDQPQVTLSDYDEPKLRQEMSLFVDWFLKIHLNVPVSPESEFAFRACADTLVEVCRQQPQVWVHRDFHSRNLMVMGHDSPGVIDFQDMVVGPITYDLVSLYKDCYIQWPRSQQLAWLRDYWIQASSSLGLEETELETVVRWYDLTGLQRHLKVLGVFSRLYHRDGKCGYLADLPLVANYVLEVLDLYPEFAPFNDAFRDDIESVI